MLSDVAPLVSLNHRSAQLGGDLEFLAGTFSSDKKKTAMALVRGIQVRLYHGLYTVYIYVPISVSGAVY